MSASTRSPESDDVIIELELDRDLQKEREPKGPKAKGSSKVKDLSHVPCKFYKVGSCTAGPSCPFSHSAHEAGQKDLCAWYVKGNCKFGHKCALAHILPGQTMAMDRKNKKAAQQAQQAAGGPGREGGAGGSGNGRGGRGSKSKEAGGKSGPRNPLLAGSTAPTRILGGGTGGPSMNPLKATISPSAPAPPLKDIDFAALGLHDVQNQLSSAPAIGRSSTEGALATHETAVGITASGSGSGTTPPSTDAKHPAKSPPSPLPVHSPSNPVRIAGSPGDFGPIGSPTRAIGMGGRPTRINGFSPATSPPADTAMMATSPFSAPASKPAFSAYETSTSFDDLRSRSGLAASLGARHWAGDRMPSTNRSTSGPINGRNLPAEAVGEEDLEEFLPGSLTDLLTPEERSRRMSRNNSNKPGVPFQRPTMDNMHHKHSRSFPANSLLGEVKSIWADAEGGLGGGLGSGAASSFKSTSSVGGLNGGEEGFSPSMLAPSNASAAFLPGLRHHYMSAKGERAGGQRSVSHNQYDNPQHVMSSGLPGSVPLNGLMSQLGPDMSQAGPPGLDAYSRPGRSMAMDYAALEMEEQQLAALSPSTRALQAHAPGQSLPQGLAAGYSRIHALPPPPSIPSPSAFSAGNMSGQFHVGSASSVRDWTSTSPGLGSIPNLGGAGPIAHASHSYSHSHSNSGGAGLGGAPGTTQDAGGLSSMFSQLSYSAAATRGPGGGGVAGTAPMGMGARNPSGRSYGGPPGLSSPLGGPVITNDDDVLFNFE